MGPLPPEILPPVQHVIFGIFNLAIPNILAWVSIAVVFLVFSWARLPHIFHPAEPAMEEERDEPYT
jgi:hypothetical protein